MDTVAGYCKWELRIRYWKAFMRGNRRKYEYLGGNRRICKDIGRYRRKLEIGGLKTELTVLLKSKVALANHFLPF